MRIKQEIEEHIQKPLKAEESETSVEKAKKPSLSLTYTHKYTKI